jgi:hypothetical protein
MSLGFEQMGGFEAGGFIPDLSSVEGFDFEGALDIYQDTRELAEEMGLEINEADFVDAMAEVFESYPENVEDFENRMTQALENLIDTEVMAEIDRLISGTDNWEQKIIRLRELRRYVDSEQVDSLAISFCERVLGDYCQRLDSMSPQEAYMAIQDLIHDQGNGMFGRLQGTLEEFGDTGVTSQRMWLLFRTTVRNLLAKNLDYTFGSREDYLEHIQNMPVDMEGTVQMAIQEVTQIEQAANMELLAEPVDWYLQEVARASVAFEVAMENLSNEQLNSATSFYDESILPRLEEGINEGNINERMQVVRQVLDMAEAERQRFIDETPSGRLTRVGLGAYQRLGDVALVRALEDIPESMFEQASEEINDLLEGRPLAQMYLAQQQMSEYLDTGELFTYTMENGFLPTEVFTSLPLSEQQGVVAMLQDVQFRVDIDSMITALDLPESINNVYQAQLAFMEGNVAEALVLVEGAINSGSLDRDLQNIDLGLSISVEQQFGFDLQKLPERAIELRKQCYFIELDNLDAFVESAGQRYRAGILTNMRGLRHEYDPHAVVGQMLNDIRVGVQSGMSWDDAYQRTVSRLDYFNQQGVQNAQEDEGYQPYDLLEDYSEIFRESDPRVRREKVLDLSRRAMDTHGLFGVGYFGLTESLIDSEFSDEFAAISQVPELQTLREEMLGRLQEEIGGSIRRDVVAALQRSYGEEWAALSVEERNAIISERLDLVYENVADDIMVGETMRYVANNPERFYELGGLVEVADLYNTAAVRYNRIMVFEEMVEPLLVAAIETAIAIPLGVGMGNAVRGAASIARVARMGRLGQFGASAAVRLSQGVTIQTARGLTRGALTNDWTELTNLRNWTSGVAVESVTMGLLGYTSRFDLTNGLALMSVLKTGAAYAGETTALTMIDRAGDRIAGRESDTFAQDFVQNGLFVFMARSVRGSLTLGRRAQVNSNSRFAELYRGLRSTYAEAGVNVINPDRGII